MSMKYALDENKDFARIRKNAGETIIMVSTRMDCLKCPAC